MGAVIATSAAHLMFMAHTAAAAAAAGADPEVSSGPLVAAIYFGDCESAAAAAARTYLT